MTFTERRFADEYVQRLTEFIVKARHNGRHIEQIGNDVFYATNTFNAYQTKKDRRKFPGITRHDIYFAYEAEKLWEEYLFARKAKLPPPSVKSLGVVVRSVRAYGISVSKWITNKASEFTFGADINRAVSEDAGDTTASPPPTEQDPSS
ncbi:hypothetical protein PsYK624_088990 [Phanerochaete sordida]|uniref:Uncharacterized protein n=1 Tax=Phanerochaete sordida TaxID=48140 RepID=A0A9P3LFJ6_9APHY|nr:hypothetical protein PsYK624_088990 [Phanerochaete sordida]